MSRFGTRVRRRWDEEDESDVDDLFIIASLLEGSKRNKRKKKFHGALPGRRKVPRDINSSR
jgi:predicted nucleotidyltransferase